MNTPTEVNSEREALIEKIKLAGHLSAQVMVFQGDTYPVKTIPYTSFLHILDGFRRSEVPGPSVRKTWSHDPQCEQARGKLACGCESRGWRVIEHPEPQGEPSDAQVTAALVAWEGQPTRVEAMRAALRAAQEAR